MAGPPIDPSAAHYVQMMGAHRRGLVRHGPLVLVALGLAIAVGLASPDRAPTQDPPAAASAKEARAAGAL
jgi:hypothetical protein